MCVCVLLSGEDCGRWNEKIKFCDEEDDENDQMILMFVEKTKKQHGI